MTSQDIIAIVFTGALLLLVAFVALAVFFTAGDDGGIAWPPHWPQRYPARPQHRAPKTARGIYGDVRAHLREDEAEAGRHAEVKR